MCDAPGAPLLRPKNYDSGARLTHRKDRVGAARHTRARRQNVRPRAQRPDPECPPAMYVCSCNALTDHDVRAIAAAASCVAEVYACLGCTPCCGVCARTIRKVLADAHTAAACACPQGCRDEAEACPAHAAAGTAPVAAPS